MQLAFGYTGQQQDGESGLVYLRARYYDPKIGRFLSKDPVRGATTRPASQHAYVYAYNNPVKFTDPTGRLVEADLEQPGGRFGFEGGYPGLGVIVVLQGYVAPGRYGIDLLGIDDSGIQRLITPGEAFCVEAGGCRGIPVYLPGRPGVTPNLVVVDGKISGNVKEIIPIGPRPLLPPWPGPTPGDEIKDPFVDRLT